VVDENWKIDEDAPQEFDSNKNINNVLLPEHIKRPGQSATAPTEGLVATEMSGVTPESTTAALAAEVPKEAEMPPEPEAKSDPGIATISSAAPDSTTAELAKDVPLEHPPPGTFPETPAKEPEQFSVKPLPATAGIGNPIQLKPGETVPDPSTLTENTVTSSVTTDKAGYERDASAPGISPPAPGIVPEPSTAGPVPTIQSAAPTSTTAALAGVVPPEVHSDVKSAVPESPAPDVPQVVKESIEVSHAEPEAAGSAEAVAQKKEVEEELVKDVKADDSAGAGKAAAPETPVPKQKTTTEGTPTTDKKKKHRASGIFKKLKEKFK